MSILLASDASLVRHRGELTSSAARRAAPDLHASASALQARAPPWHRRDRLHADEARVYAAQTLRASAIAVFPTLRKYIVTLGTASFRRARPATQVATFAHYNRVNPTSISAVQLNSGGTDGV
jgi:hypothetical protein